MHSVKLKLFLVLLSFQAVLSKGISSSSISVDPAKSVVTDTAGTFETKALKHNNYNYNWYPNGQYATDPQQYASSYQQLSRDSYSEAATDLGYSGAGGGGGHDHGHGGHQSNSYSPPSQPGTTYGSGPPIMYRYKVYPSAHVHKRTKYGSGGKAAGNRVASYEPPSYSPPSEYGNEYGVDDGGEGEEGGGLGGLVGLVGLLGLKGLKALIPFGILPLLPILIPLILPLLILPIGLLIVAALFIPIPLLVIPGGRSLTQTARVAKVLALSEDCIERITCETARFARGYGFDATWVDKFLERTSSSANAQWMEKVSRGAKSVECKQYTCNPIASLKKSFKFTKKTE